jgi:hypothetical protein
LPHPVFSRVALFSESRINSVGITTGQGLDCPASNPCKGDVSLTSTAPRSTLVSVHPTSYPMCKGPFFLGAKRPEIEADHPPPCSIEVKKDGAVPPFPHTFSWPSIELI